eukprot:12927911-Prorocentrum_lima.AAC.1
MVQDQEGEPQCQALSIGHLWERKRTNGIQRALMNGPGEPFAMWDSGASHFVLPMTSLPRSATGTSRAV